MVHICHYCGRMVGVTVHLCDTCSWQYTRDCKKCGKFFEIVDRLHCDLCNNNYCIYYECVKSDCHHCTK